MQLRDSEHLEPYTEGEQSSIVPRFRRPTEVTTRCFLRLRYIDAPLKGNTIIGLKAPVIYNIVSLGAMATAYVPQLVQS